MDTVRYYSANILLPPKTPNSTPQNFRELPSSLSNDIDDILKEGFMAQIIVRNLEEEVKNGLRRRASQHGRSVEEEVRDILRNAVKAEGKRQPGLGSEIKKIFQGIGIKQGIPEWKGTSPKTTDFES
jgi:hypothetical protein